jgi:Ca-activated chloride channel family protein
VRGVVALVAAALGTAAAQEEPLVFGVEVEVVRVEVLVTRSGEPVRGLQAENFQLRDNGVPQRLRPITFEEAPVDALLVLDLSASVMGAKLEALRDAAGAFLDGLGPEDRAALVGFQQSVAVAVPLTSEIPQVRFGVNTALVGGSTALHDAVYLALRLTAPGPRRAAVVVFSDGVDNTSWLSAGAVVEAAGRSGAVVYAVDAREPGDPSSRFLRDVAQATGGRVWRVRRSDDLRDRFLDVLHDIRARYVLSYTPGEAGAAGWHQLEVDLRGTRGDILARPAYYRPERGRAAR